MVTRILKYNNPLNGYGWLLIATRSHYSLDIWTSWTWLLFPDITRARARTHDRAYPESDAVMSTIFTKKTISPYSHKAFSRGHLMSTERELSNGKTRQYIQVG